MSETLPGPYKPENSTDCPPELKFELKGPLKEWENRAKTFNEKSFKDHAADISAVKGAAGSLLAQTALNTHTTADDRALLGYIHTLSADKPTPIVLMQKMLKDGCDQSIAIDGRVGEQTIAAMKLVVEQLKAKDPNYKREQAVQEQTEKPLQHTQAEVSEKSKTVAHLNDLLQQNYGDRKVSINEKGELFSQGAKIATIDLSKGEDTIWDNIRVTLEPSNVTEQPKPIAEKTESIDTTGIRIDAIETYTKIEREIQDAMKKTSNPEQLQALRLFQTANRDFYSTKSGKWDIGEWDTVEARTKSFKALYIIPEPSLQKEFRYQILYRLIKRHISIMMTNQEYKGLSMRMLHNDISKTLDSAQTEILNQLINEGVNQAQTIQSQEYINKTWSSISEDLSKYAQSRGYSIQFPQVPPNKSQLTTPQTAHIIGGVDNKTNQEISFEISDEVNGQNIMKPEWDISGGIMLIINKCQKEEGMRIYLQGFEDAKKYAASKGYELIGLGSQALAGDDNIIGPITLSVKKAGANEEINLGFYTPEQGEPSKMKSAETIAQEIRNLIDKQAAKE